MQLDEQSEQREQFEQFEQREQREQYEQSEQPEQSEQSEQPEQSEQREQPDSVAKAAFAALILPQYATVQRLPLSSVTSVRAFIFRAPSTSVRIDLVRLSFRRDFSAMRRSVATPFRRFDLLSRLARWSWQQPQGRNYRHDGRACQYDQHPRCQRGYGDNRSTGAWGEFFRCHGSSPSSQGPIHFTSSSAGVNQGCSCFSASAKPAKSPSTLTY